MESGTEKHEHVPVVLVFDRLACCEATDVTRFSVFGDAEDERLLGPWLRGRITDISEESSPAPVNRRYWQIHIAGLQMLTPLPAVLGANTADVLAASLIIGVHSSPSPLFNGLDRFLEATGQFALAEHGERRFNFPFPFDHVEVHIFEALHKVAVKYAGKKAAKNFVDPDSVTLSEADINTMKAEFIHDPSAICESTREDLHKLTTLDLPASDHLKCTLKVLCYLMLLGGFVDTFILTGRLRDHLRDRTDVLLKVRREMFAGPAPRARPRLASDLVEHVAPKFSACDLAIGFLELLRLHLAQSRFLFVAGAPNVGKTEALREVFKIEKLKAGVDLAEQTDTLVFVPHPGVNDAVGQVFVVDTPGYGEMGDKQYRNEFSNLLVFLAQQLPGAVQLVWVERAGRSQKLPAHDLLGRFLQSSENLIKPFVLVSHIDEEFERHYENRIRKLENGEEKDETGLLDIDDEGDSRWKHWRDTMMLSLKQEVEVFLGELIEPQQCRTIFACLGGWMARRTRACKPKGEWERDELVEHFKLLQSAELRSQFDKALRLACTCCM